MKLLRFLTTVVIALGVGVFLFLTLTAPPARELPIREAVVSSALEDTGAQNLVSAIYLGYRAFDTLGETIVLLLAVAGVAFLIREPS
jgi:multisubunit Na+/H+ antiporter MnhB subunit